MSEVQDACQILIVTGKGAYLLGEILVKTAAMVLKVLNTAYLSKWKGSSSLKRFRAIKGDDQLFVNVGTEQKSALRKTEREMKEHGILFAKMPDLCGGDSRTQYVISAGDAANFKAFLLDHNEGKNKKIRVGMISAEDYARSGYDAEGKERPELQALGKSARENLEKRKGQRNRTLTKKGPAGRKISDQKEDVKKVKTAPEKESIKSMSFDASPKGPTENDMEIEPYETISPAAHYGARRHDECVRREKDAEWISRVPVKGTEDWQMFEMPDGLHSVVVPAEDHYSIPLGNTILHRTALYRDKTYTIVDLDSGRTKKQSGKLVAEAMRHLDYRAENKQLKNMQKDRKPEMVFPERGKEIASGIKEKLSQAKTPVRDTPHI